MNKIKELLKRIIYAIPFGLKGGNEVLTQKEELVNDKEMHEEVSDERVAKHLLKGEITKSVEELRYRTVKVDKEARNYDYVANGIAKKKTKKFDNGEVKKFTQEIHMVCNDIKTEISHVGDFGEESYTAQIEYTEPLVRFHIEEFLKEIQVNISKGKSTTVLCFESSPNVDMSKSMPFINELKKILQGAKNIEERYSKSESYEKFLNAFIERNEIISTIKEIEFVTYKASNLYPDFMKLTFRNPHFKKIELKNCYFYITFDWDESDELNLMDKFYSKSMDEKYKNKEKKDYYDGIRIDNKDFKDQI